MSGRLGGKLLDNYIMNLYETDKSALMAVGGKGANLGELTRIKGIHVPQGFCVTTEAYIKAIEGNKNIVTLIDALSPLKANDTAAIHDICNQLRHIIETVEMPPGLAASISNELLKSGEQHFYAVRSSATAEDLPGASFAGQQDTYLNRKGLDDILFHVKRCWASLFTDRAVTYRIQNGYDHHKVYLSVVIQKMVLPQASGIMFTADPITQNRKVLSIDAGFGLGEALVSGLVSADNYQVRGNRIINKTIAEKKLLIQPLQEGGVNQCDLPVENQHKQTLSDEQILELSTIGRKIEAYFGCPQDIEWCLDSDRFTIVQSRPITTLYPVIAANDGKNHVYLCMGHSQMMTDAMKPLGLAFFPLFIEQIGLPNAGGRLYMDCSPDLRSLPGRFIFVKAMGSADPYSGDALGILTKRRDFIRNLAKGFKTFSFNNGYFTWRLPVEFVKVYFKKDVSVVDYLFLRSENALAVLDKQYAKLSGTATLDQVKVTLEHLQEVMYDAKIMAAIFSGVMAQRWLNKKLNKWLGEQKIGEMFSQSVANNVTSNMGLELLDVADVVRNYPDIISYIENPNSESFFDDLSRLSGGDRVAEAVKSYLAKYGHRCTGEIDITRARFHERPTDLCPLILNNIRNTEPDSHKIFFEKKLAGVKAKEKDILTRLSKRKAKKTKKQIDLLRGAIGFREYPKYAMVKCFWIIKQAWMREAEKLVKLKVLFDKEDVYYLDLEEFRAAIVSKKVDYNIIDKRKNEFKTYEKLTPPRVMTNEGEIISGRLNRKVPAGALAGMAVSSGIAEGRARVVSKLGDAHMEDGDILVTAFTDPSWTPVFVSIKGLITEVGGQMTHGAVIAREYGLPAVVSVENATTRIKDGQRIRVNGTEGFVEVLEDAVKAAKED